MKMVKPAVAAASLSVSALLITGCGGINDVPLPGGANVGSNPMTVHIQFDDVLDLVPQASVKVDGVPVGRVDKIGVAPNGWSADVTVVVNSSQVHLPANAHAEVSQTNLLGEKFIALEQPPTGESPDKQQLASGATIPKEHTRHATDIEQVLGALSLLLNGGGIAQLQPIVTELNKTLGGRENTVRSLLTQAKDLIGGLEKQVTDIQSALDGLATLATRTAAQNDQIGKVLDELPQGVHILDEQRPEIVGMLGQLDRLGQAGYAVIGRSKDNLIHDLLSLRPTLQALGKAAPDLVTAFPLVLTYPFPDSALESVQGGQLNTWLSVDLQLGSTLNALGVGRPNPVYVPPTSIYPVNVNPGNPYYNGNGARPGWPTISVLPVALSDAKPAPPQNPIDALLNQLQGGGHR